MLIADTSAWIEFLTASGTPEAHRLIAAVAIRLSVPVLHRDRDYRRIPQTVEELRDADAAARDMIADEPW